MQCPTCGETTTTLRDILTHNAWCALGLRRRLDDAIANDCAESNRNLDCVLHGQKARKRTMTATGVL